MEYITTIEAAEKWGVCQRQIQRLLSANRIQGTKKLGRSWMIPADAEKPGDPRREKKAPENALYQGSSSLSASPTFNLSSDLAYVIASTYIPAPHDNPDAIVDIVNEERMRVIPEIGIAYARGDFAQVQCRFRGIAKDDAVKLCACPATIATAISMGDYPFYREVERYLKSVVQANINRNVSAFAELALAGAYLGAMAPRMAPAWLKEGDFSALPTQARPDAAYLRAKYFQCIGQFDSMLSVAQTTLAFCSSEQGLSFPNTYLRLLCAVACYHLERMDEAKSYLLDVMRLNLPHGFITAFTECIPLFGGMLEQLLEREFPEHYDAANEQWQRTFTNWLAFHNRFTQDNITLILSLKEYELARLVARHVPYAKIAKQYNVSIGRIKNKMNEIFGKLFVSNRKELSKIIL